MRKILLILLIISSGPLLGQKRFLLSVQLQPELTFHQNQYSYRWQDKYTKATFNIGIASELQYNLANRLFATLGIGYISRKLNTTVFLDQSKLPPPHFSLTKELNNTKDLSYRTLQIPVSVGYSFIANQKFKAFFTSGISANYLLNAYYNVGRLQYRGTYRKGYWQGLAVNGGLGADVYLAKNLWLVNIISYSFCNPVQPDKYLFSQDNDEIALPHKYLRLSMGIKMSL
jgi:hypothetical protein